MAADFFGFYSGLAGGFGGTLTWFIPVLVILAVVVAIILVIANKRSYRFPVTIYSEREHSGIKETETKGKFITPKGCTTMFRIRFGFRNVRDLIIPPKLEGMTQINRVYYYQKDPETFIQLKRIIGDDILKFVPIESDVKFGSILALRRIREVLKTEGKFDKYIAPMTIVVGLIVLAIMFYLMLDKFNPELMVQVSANSAQAAEALARAKAGGG